LDEGLTTALERRYRIERELGAGGMATVYLARDLKLERDVALKVLRPDLAAAIGAERFLREIRVTAALQHPHILAVYDSGQADSFLFYVMPFVDGESLRERLEREGQLPIDEALLIAREVADALDYAHARDIVHRDIKPENIMLAGGHAFVTDFGVARAVRAAGGERLTATGIAVGTPRYMSPEQATAENRIDGRSDIYSLGCVLYEMLAGEQPLTGPTFEATLARRLTETPRPLRAVRDTVPLEVEEAVATALARLPADRFSTAGTLARALSSPSVPRSPTATTFSTWLRRRHTVTTLQLAAGALVLTAAFLAAALAWPRRSPSRAVTRFPLALPATEPLAAATGATVALSPDGTKLVYVGDGPQLYLRPMDRLDAEPIPGTEGAYNPFFSPDGEWVAFGTAGALKKVSLAGGPPVTIWETPGVLAGGDWGANDIILLDSPVGSGLVSVPASGGKVRSIATPDSSSGTAYSSPSLLPGGDRALTAFLAIDLTEAELAVVPLESGQVTPLGVHGISPKYVSGHVVYARPDGTLIAAPIDVDQGRISGPGVPIVENVRLKGGATADFTVSESGTLVYLPAAGAARRIVLLDRTGLSRALSEDRRAFYAPRFSPDGRSVAVTVFEQGNRNIWLYDVESGAATRFTFEGDNLYPIWSPDGSRIAYTSTRDGGYDLYWSPADGSGAAERLLATPHQEYPSSWSRDGRWLFFMEANPGSGRDLWALAVGGDRKPMLIAGEPFEERSAVLSPNGRWLAYSTDESGQLEVYVRAFPGPGGRWQVSLDGGAEPLWSPDGRELFYRSGGRIMRAEVDTDPVFAIRGRSLLFERPFVPNDFHTNFDIHPDDQRFVMIESAQAATEVVVVLNWMEELNHR
jgi:serine/threonine-protein kinase